MVFDPNVLILHRAGIPRLVDIDHQVVCRPTLSRLTRSICSICCSMLNMFSRCRIYLIAVSSAPLMRIDVSQAIVFFPLQRNFNTVARPDSLLLFCFYLVFAPTACFVFSIVSPALTFYDDPFIFAFYDGGFFSSLRWVPSFSFSLTKGEGLSAYLGKTPLILTTALKISSRLGKEKPGINQVP